MEEDFWGIPLIMMTWWIGIKMCALAWIRWAGHNKVLVARCLKLVPRKPWLKSVEAFTRSEAVDGAFPDDKDKFQPPWKRGMNGFYSSNSNPNICEQVGATLRGQWVFLFVEGCLGRGWHGEWRKEFRSVWWGRFERETGSMVSDSLAQELIGMMGLSFVFSEEHVLTQHFPEIHPKPLRPIVSHPPTPFPPLPLLTPTNAFPSLLTAPSTSTPPSPLPRPLSSLSWSCSSRLRSKSAARSPCSPKPIFCCCAL